MEGFGLPPTPLRLPLARAYGEPTLPCLESVQLLLPDLRVPYHPLSSLPSVRFRHLIPDPTLPLVTQQRFAECTFLSRLTGRKAQ